MSGFLIECLMKSLIFIFELVELRLDSVSTILCTQFTRADWHDRLGVEFVLTQSCIGCS